MKWKLLQSVKEIKNLIHIAGVHKAGGHQAAAHWVPDHQDRIIMTSFDVFHQ